MDTLCSLSTDRLRVKNIFIIFVNIAFVIFNDRPPLRSDTGFAQHVAMAAYLFNLFLVFRILLRTEMVIHILYTQDVLPQMKKFQKVDLGLGYRGDVVSSN